MAGGKRPGSALESNKKRPKTTTSTSKLCTVCGTAPTVLKTSPTSCNAYHGDAEKRACGECWEAYLSMAVEELRAEDIECMFCTSLLPEGEVKRLSRDQTGERYDAKILHRKKQTCQARCVASRILRADGLPQRTKHGSYDFVLQDHDSEIGGRIFACKLCEYATCIVCDRPEHEGESCEEYQTRTGMLDELPMVQLSGRRATKKTAIKGCPGCKAYWMLGDGGGCGYVKCNACQFRFCQRCLVPWVGQGSAYLVGKKAHGIDSTDGKVCTYRDRLTFSGHSLQNRFELTTSEKEELARSRVQIMSSYGFTGTPLVGDGSLGYSRMTKRRRIDDADSTWDGGPAQQQQQQQQSHESEYPEIQNVSYSGTTGSGLGGSLDAPPLPQQPWSSTGTGASPYPDVSSYSQPYFYQQTDPLTYTAPWPPVTDGNTYNNPSTYSADVAAPADMPFFPPHSTSEQTAVYDTTATAAPAMHSQNFPQGDASLQYNSYYNDQQVHADAVQPPAANSAFYLDDASMHLKLQSLPILDNLATQLIHTIAKASYPQIQDMMRGNETEEGQAYVTLKNLFDQTRKVYSRETPFIDAIAIQMFQPTQQELIRKANIATFVSSILGAHDVSFFHLNEYFMETFVPSGHRLLKWQGAIYLELKTQTYISAIMNSDGSPEAMLDELFPGDLDALILTRHPDAPSLSPSEQDFIDRCRARKSYLLAEPSTEEAVQELPKKYQWNDFVREFASCISKNVDGIMNVPVRSQAAGQADKRSANAAQGDGLSSAKNAAGAQVPGVPALTHQASSTAEKKSSAPSSTIRQPWTKPEEDALLSGLEKVNGPHWSQILALYGRGGSMSEVLKDRNQVQLKDKARNLKLWYLKMGKEVPVALRGVTGELRKRGGARARAALGMLDDDQDGGAENGEDAEENLDPDLGQRQERRPSKKKKARK